MSVPMESRAAPPASEPHELPFVTSPSALRQGARRSYSTSQEASEYAWKRMRRDNYRAFALLNQYRQAKQPRD